MARPFSSPLHAAAGVVSSCLSRRGQRFFFFVFFFCETKFEKVVETVGVENRRKTMNTVVENGQVVAAGTKSWRTPSNIYIYIYILLHFLSFLFRQKCFLLLPPLHCNSFPRVSLFFFFFFCFFILSLRNRHPWIISTCITYATSLVIVYTHSTITD